MAKNDTITIGALSISIAEELGVDQGTVAKKLRARIRNNFDKLAPQWPGLQEAKDNRDGNRYPPMPRALADELALKVKSGAKDEAETETEAPAKPKLSKEEKAAKKARKAAKAAAKAAKAE